jgi:uncharacterized protein (DUF2336 family)
MSRLTLRRPAGGSAVFDDYETAKRVASNGSVAEREALARREDVRPELLYFLAEDADARVRRIIAANPVTPVHAGTRLARDRDDEVRCALAERFGRLMPQLDENERSRVGRIAGEVLEALARDQLPRVRRILAETLRHRADVPASVIRRLARDVDAEVAAPVLEFSPLLDDATLIEIIASQPDAPALAAIARRHHLAGPVSDAVADTGDVAAVAALLSNESAQIREETLDRLVERAADVPEWHAPLVRRPRLSPRAVRGLARIVARTLLSELARRADLDSETAVAVAASLNERLDRDLPDPYADAATDAAGAGNPTGEPAEARARRMVDEGTLDDSAMLDALGRGDRAFAAAGLALRAGLAEEVVHKAVSLRNAKAITALAWRAGLSMRTAVQLQLRLARIPPNALLHPRGGTDFPLDEDDMRWQIELIGG